jgi:hypothetical protein
VLTVPVVRVISFAVPAQPADVVIADKLICGFRLVAEITLVDAVDFGVRLKLDDFGRFCSVGDGEFRERRAAVQG